VLEDPNFINKTTTENAPPQAEKGKGKCGRVEIVFTVYTYITIQKKVHIEKNEDIS
jgi:hypothetical protein